MADPRRVRAARAHVPPLQPLPEPNANPDVPRKRYKGSATLSYRANDEAAWQLLDTLRGACEYPASNVNICLDNAVSIWQVRVNPAEPELVDEWRIRYEYNQIIRYLVRPMQFVGPRREPGFEVLLVFRSRPCISRDFSSVPSWGQSPTQEFPINVQSALGRTFSNVRLEILAQPNRNEYHQAAAGQPRVSVIFTAPNIERLLAGEFPTSQLEDIHTWCHQNVEALGLERDTAERLMQTLLDCSANVSQHRHAAHLRADQGDYIGEQMQLDVTLADNELLDLENAPEAYELRGRPGMLFDPEDAATGRYQIADRIEFRHWEASVVTIADDRRHIRLVVLNDTRNYNQFGVNDVELDLFPIFMDPTYDIAREGIERYFKIVSTHIDMQDYRQARSHGQYPRIVAEYNDPEHNPLTPLAVLRDRNDGQNLYFSLPLPSIMLRSHPAVTAAHRAPLAALLTPLSTLANPSQWGAVIGGLTNQFTMIKGAAATGKSLTLAILIHQFLEDRPGRRRQQDAEKRILYLAPTNQAADVGLQATARLFQAYNLPQPFCRWYSNHMVEQDYLRNEWQHWGPFHIENLRIQLARERRDYNFLAGVHCFQRQGRIQRPLTYKRYKYTREQYTRLILQDKLVVFSSCVAASHTLGHGWEYALYFQPKMLIIDEFWSAKPYEIAGPVSQVHTLERVILAGDGQQLGPTYRNQRVQTVLWPTTVAVEYSTRRFPTYILDTQYRSHNALYRPISLVIYRHTIGSRYRTNEPRAYLSNLMAQLPRSFVAPNNGGHYHLHQYAQFIHVRGGVRSEPGSSSSVNYLQGQTASRLVQALVAIDGVESRDITVVSPYNGHTRYMKTLAERDGWFVQSEGNVGPKGNVISIDSSQSAENEILIFCIVRSSGGLDFAGNPPRVNVGLSRAREALFIIGDWDWIQGRTVARDNKLVRILNDYNANIPAPGFVVRPVAQRIAPRPNVQHRHVAQQQIANIRRLRQNHQQLAAARQTAINQFPQGHQWPNMDAYRADIPAEPIRDHNWDTLETRLTHALTVRR